MRIPNSQPTHNYLYKFWPRSMTHTDIRLQSIVHITQYNYKWYWLVKTFDGFVVFGNDYSLILCCSCWMQYIVFILFINIEGKENFLTDEASCTNNSDSGNDGLLPNGTKPLPEPKLTYYQRDTLAFFPVKYFINYSSCQPSCYLWKLHFWRDTIMQILQKKETNKHAHGNPHSITKRKQLRNQRLYRVCLCCMSFCQ